jgi:putative SOS response-associated peptidase YedK
MGKTETGKQPYALALADRGLMAPPELWKNWRSPTGEWMRSFAIFTTKPNELCAELHDRMPVVLAPMCGRYDSARDPQTLSNSKPFSRHIRQII